MPVRKVPGGGAAATDRSRVPPGIAAMATVPYTGGCVMGIRSGGVLLGVMTVGLAVMSVHRASRDLASWESTEAQLRAALEVQDEFVAMASHEMRTPLTVISGAFGLLTDHGHALTDEQRHALLTAATRQLARLERLSSNLLLTQRLTEGEGPRHGPAEPFTPGAVLTDLAGGDVTVDGDEQLEVEGDRTLLELVVGNLLDNATRYGRPPVTVTYRPVGREAGSELEVTVADRGQGVPPAFEPELFGRFTQASRGLDRHTGGTGLGLWLSRQLLTATGGTITYARPPAGGAAFTVRLPVRPLSLDHHQAATGPLVTAS